MDCMHALIQFTKALYTWLKYLTKVIPNTNTITLEVRISVYQLNGISAFIRRHNDKTVVYPPVEVPLLDTRPANMPAPWF